MVDVLVDVYVQPLEEAGYTKYSIDFVRRYSRNAGDLLAVSLIRKVDGMPVTAFICEKCSIVTFGFNWGYGGEGPTGLYKVINEIFKREFPMKEITDMNMEWCYTILFSDEGYRVIGQNPMTVLSGSSY